MDNKKVIKDVKDNSYKKIFDNPELFCQFLRTFTNISLLKNIKPEDIIDCTDRYIPLFIEQKDTDTVKIVKIKEDIFVITMLEHQSKICYDMPFRILLYMTLIWHEWIKQKDKDKKGISKTKDFKLPPILPMVYYTGTNTWSAEINFNKSVYLNDVFKQYIPDFKYELVSLNDYSIENLLKFENIISFMMIMDKILKPEEIKDILNMITEEYIQKIKGEIPDNLLGLLKDIVFLFLKKINIPKVESQKIEDLIYKRRFSEMFDALKDYDVQKVRKEVAEEVTKEVTLKIAEKLIQFNEPIEKICEITGLTVEEVNQLKK